jgi:hypothetical protein
MDMKRILEKLDQASSKPAVDSSDMKRFVSIVNEGANPHKVALPVQMAMQHYQEVTEKTPSRVGRESVIGKYFQEAEQAITQREEENKQERKQLLNQYAKIIAERVRLK